jgi:hypothetical protein
MDCNTQINPIEIQNGYIYKGRHRSMACHVNAFWRRSLLQNIKMKRALLTTIGLLSPVVLAQTCPKLARTSPALIKPKNCPSWSSVPKAKGSLKDNECLIGGILGVLNSNKQIAILTLNRGISLTLALPPTLPLAWRGCWVAKEWKIGQEDRDLSRPAIAPIHRCQSTRSTLQ